MCLPYLLFTVTTGLLWWILQKSSIWRLKKLETTVAIATLTVCLSRVEFKSGFPVAVWCSVLVSGLRCRNHWKMCVSGTKRPERLLRAGAEQRKWLVSIASAVKVLCAASVFCLVQLEKIEQCGIVFDRYFRLSGWWLASWLVATSPSSPVDGSGRNVYFSMLFSAAHPTGCLLTGSPRDSVAVSLNNLDKWYLSNLAYRTLEWEVVPVCQLVATQHIRVLSWISGDETAMSS